MQTLIILLLTGTSVFMILLVLIQRGKGGGLAGAFGGMGGQSAFGTKAGDTFTKITVVTAILWFVLCVAALKMFSDGTGSGIRVGEGRSGMLSPGQSPGEAVDPNPVPVSIPAPPTE